MSASAAGTRVAKLAQASIALAEQLFGLTILALPVRQKSRDGQGLTNQQRVTQLPCQRHGLVAEGRGAGIVALEDGQHPRRHEGLHAGRGCGIDSTAPAPVRASGALRGRAHAPATGHRAGN